MNNALTHLSATHEAARSKPAKVSPRRYGLTTPGDMLAAWEERMRIRWQLKQMSGDPHLIDDIGLTRRQVEAEIAKPFWQA